jgi:hypothetical protein
MHFRKLVRRADDRRSLFRSDVPAVHGFIVLDTADAAKPREVSRLSISDSYHPHWTGWDPKTQRLGSDFWKHAEGSHLPLSWIRDGALSVDETFRDVDGQPGSVLPSANGRRLQGVGTPPARCSRAERLQGALRRVRPCRSQTQGAETGTCAAMAVKRLGRVSILPRLPWMATACSKPSSA